MKLSFTLTMPHYFMKGGYHINVVTDKWSQHSLDFSQEWPWLRYFRTLCWTTI